MLVVDQQCVDVIAEVGHNILAVSQTELEIVGAVIAGQAIVARTAAAVGSSRIDRANAVMAVEVQVWEPAE